MSQNLKKQSLKTSAGKFTVTHSIIESYGHFLWGYLPLILLVFISNTVLGEPVEQVGISPWGSADEIGTLK